ncbi:MAG: hypothetical protein HY716_13445 [Planctomycetes bacterium]|nr:hypothetical protein [Planctomycetota bacterium]
MEPIAPASAPAPEPAPAPAPPQSPEERVAWLTAKLAEDPASAASILLDRARARTEWACSRMRELEALQGRPADSSIGDLLRAAAEDGEEALKKGADKLEAVLAIAEVQRHGARLETAAGAEPGRAYRPAVERYHEALRLNPDSVEALIGRADARSECARARIQRSQLVGVTQREFDSAIADYSDALRRDPQCAAARIGRAVAGHQQGILDLGFPDRSARLLRNAFDDFDEGLRLDPSNARNHFLKAEAHYELAVHLFNKGTKDFEHYRLARAAYEESARLDPAIEPALRDHLRICRTVLESGGEAAAASGHIIWAKTWGAAKREARIRRVPILLYVSGGAG